MQAGYFFFAITPTSALSFYVSQSILIAYTDQNDLSTQQNAYFHNLLSYANADGNDPSNYNQQASSEYTNVTDCDAVRTTYITDLRNNGSTVKEVNLQANANSQHQPKSSKEYNGKVNGIDVQAIDGLRPRCQAFIVYGAPVDTQVTAYSPALQLKLEIASILGSLVSVTCNDDTENTVVDIKIEDIDLFKMATAIAKFKNVLTDESQKGRIRVLDR